MDARRAIATELHRPARRCFTRCHVTLKGINDLYQADLVEMIPYAKVNKGMKYILTMINCFTKVAIAVPLRSKSAGEVSSSLEPILKKHKMKHFQTDQGTEWFNSQIKRLMVKYKINHYHTYSEVKAGIIERWNRTLKEKLWRMFTAQGSYEWLSILPKIVKEYNGTVHRTIGLKPKDVRQKHVKGILERLNRRKMPTHKSASVSKFKVNDKVRISKYKRVFKKGYLPNWTNETFTIHAVKHTQPVTYVLKDSKGEILKGGFYDQELAKAKTGNVYLVEKVIKTKGDKVLVRWAGFDQSSDTWVNKKDIL